MWSRNQQIALAIVPKFSAIASLLGSSWIIVEVCRGVHGEHNIPNYHGPYHRLLLAMSIYDVLESIWNFFSSWAIPRGTPNIYAAKGTTASCSAQGFFLTLSVAVPINNAFLSLYYLLVVNYSMTDDQLKKRVEPCMHAAAFIFSFGTAMYSLVTDMFNNASLWCWIAPFPVGCTESWDVGRDKATCTRGDNSFIFRWAFYFGPLWICIAFAATCTFLVIINVKKLDKRTLAFRQPETSIKIRDGREAPSIDSTDGEPHQTREEKKGLTNWIKKRRIFAQENPRTVQVQMQAFWYLVVFALTHVWSTTNRIMQQFNRNTFFPIILLHSFFDPLQGFTNFLVYRRPRYIRLRKDHPQWSRFRTLKRTLLFSFQRPVDSQEFQGARTTEQEHKKRQVARFNSVKLKANNGLPASPSQQSSSVDDSLEKNEPVRMVAGSQIEVEQSSMSWDANSMDKAPSYDSDADNDDTDHDTQIRFL